MSGCFICEKHLDMSSVPGGAIAEDEHIVVSHLPLVTPQGTAESVYLGRLVLEPRRHVEDLGELTDDQAASLGRMAARGSAALRRAAGAEHVYAAVISDAIPHIHLHLLPRYPATPREYWWVRLDEWPDAPMGGADEVAELAERLRAVA
jgi:diadenosine tetraphosphate (Ap4A) HIT family hydrolase